MRCPQCGAEWPTGTRFCANCGTPLLAAEAPPMEPAAEEGERGPVAGRQPPAEAKEKRKGRGCLRGCLVALLVVVLVIGVGAGAAAYYFYAPDLPPLSSYLPSWDDIRDQVPFLRSAAKPLPPLDPELKKELAALRAELDKPRLAQKQREEQALKQLQGTGLPVTGVYMMETGKGESVLGVTVSYEQMVRGVSASGGMAEGVDALVRLAQTKALDLSALSYTTLAVRDDQGRTLFGVTAAVEDIERFRQGQIDRREFIKRTAAKVESRAGVLDAIRRLAQP